MAPGQVERKNLNRGLDITARAQLADFVRLMTKLEIECQRLHISFL